MAVHAVNVGDYSNQSCSLERVTSGNRYGEATYAAPVTLRCRVQRTYKLRRTSEGEEQVHVTILYFPAGTPVGIDDKVTVDGQTSFVTSVTRHVDLFGAESHFRATLGNA